MLEGFGDFALVTRGDHLDVIFKVHKEGKVEVVVDKYTSACWPIVIDTCSVMRRTSVDTYAEFAQELLDLTVNFSKLVVFSIKFSHSLYNFSLHLQLDLSAHHWDEREFLEVPSCHNSDELKSHWLSSYIFRHLLYGGQFEVMLEGVLHIELRVQIRNHRVEDILKDLECFLVSGIDAHRVFLVVNSLLDAELNFTAKVSCSLLHLRPDFFGQVFLEERGALLVKDRVVH